MMSILPFPSIIPVLETEQESIRLFNALGGTHGRLTITLAAASRILSRWSYYFHLF